MNTEKESHVRSLLKGLTWRITGTIVAVAIAYFYTRRIEDALKFGAVDFVIKFFLYYAHERAWQLVPRGTIKNIFTKKAKDNFEI